MKLIRLTAKDDNVFNNNFQADLQLNENSQIALLNASFEKEQITYTTSNDIFNYTIGTPDMTTDPLNDATYNKDNFKDLLDDIEFELNASLNVSNPTQAGSGFEVKLNSSNKVQIQTKYGYETNPFSNSDFVKKDVETTGNNVYQKDNATSENTPNAYVGSNELNSFEGGVDGCGYFRFTLNQLNNVDGGVYIALSTSQPEDMGGNYEFNTTNITYGIYAKNSGSNYEFIDENGLSVSTLAPENFALNGNDNDVLCIRASEGLIEGVIYSDSHRDGIVLFSEQYTDSKKLWPIVGFYSQTNVSIRNFKYTPSYTALDDNSLLSSGLLDLDVGSPNPPTQDSNNHDPMKFRFPNLELAKFLGFKEQEIILSHPDDVFRLTGNNPISFTDNTEVYIVELMNLKLESFDGFKEERKNILALINNARESTLDDVLYEANNLVYLDLNNQFKQILRNIEVRIVDDEYNKVNIQGRANMTILIKDKNEK